MAEGHGGARAGAGRKPGAWGTEKKALADAAKEHAPAALEALAKILADEAAPASVKVSAAVAILDRAYGRPAQAIEARIEEAPQALVLSEPMTEEQWERIHGLQGAPVVIISGEDAEL